MKKLKLSMLSRCSRWLVCILALLGLWTTQAIAQNVNVSGAAVGDGSYPTLQAAFAAINVAGNNGSGPIDVSLVNSTTETGTSVLDNITWASVTVTAATPVTVQGTITGAIVKLNGADNVTIDGRIAGAGRNITIQNNANVTSTAAVWLASVAVGNGCTNNTIRNCIIACGAPQNTGGLITFGVLIGGTTISSTATTGNDNDNNAVIDNFITKSRFGICTRGASATNLNQNTSITDNLIGPSAHGVDQIGVQGILVQFENNCTISGNEVRFVGGDFANTSAGADRVGIALGTAAWSATSTTTATSTNLTVTRNLIHDIIEERTFSAAGIVVGTTNGGAPTNNLICSNIIYNVKSNGTSSDMTVGIGISGGHSDNVVHNSIYLYGDVDPSAGATAPSIYGCGIRISQASSASFANLNLKNNAIHVDLSSSSAPTVRFYAISAPSNAYTFGTGGQDFNDYYVNPLNAQCILAGLGTTSVVALTTPFADLLTWQAAFLAPQDANSISANPNFISNTNLHTDVGSTVLNNVGTPIASCGFDFDNESRDGSSPDIGADEYLPIVCAGSAGGTISPDNASRCEGQSYTMSTTGSEVGAGISYQWEVSSTGGGAGFTDVSGGIGATTSNYNTGVLIPGVYYYRLRVTCSNGPSTGYSNELTLTVNPNPIASVDVTSATYCNPNGTAVNITASGASTIAWAPAAGLNTTSGATVSATPTSNTTYTATVTDDNNCSATATSVITVLAGMSISSISATPTTLCSGGNSQLQVAASAAGANTAAGTIYTAGSSTFESMPSPLVETTVTTGTIDDGSIAVNTLGSFAFNYNGVDYANFGIGTNGYVVIGAVSSSIPSSLASLSGLNVVYGFGRDGNINTTNGGSIRHGLDGSNTKYVFEFANFATASGGNESPTQTANMQIVLWGNTSSSPGRIDLIYGPSEGTPATAGVIGLRDAAGTFRNGVTGSTTSTPTSATFPADQTMYSFERQTYTYAWIPATFIAGQESLSNPLATGVTATTTYTVVASNTTGCSTTSNVSIVVEPLTCNAAITSATTCANTNFTVTANLTGGGAPYTYTWNDGVGGVYPDAATITANLPAGTYTFICLVGDACGNNCVSATTIVVNGLPSVSVTPNSGLICNPGGLPIPLVSSGATTYSWSPASGLSATTGDNVTANPSGTTTYTISGTDANGCVNTATAAITLGAAITAVVSAIPSSVCNGDNSQLFVNVTPTPGAGAIKITEVTTFRTGNGATNPYPAYVVGADLVEISNISSSAIDISGYTLEDHASNSATVTHPGFAFPGGTILPAGSVAVVHLGPGTDDIANRYFNTGGTNDSWLSTSPYGMVLKNSGLVIDAVGRGNPYVWNPATSVTPSDWSGNLATTSAAGIVRTAALDNNVGSDWVLSTISPASIGTFNGGYIPPVTIAGYSWSPSAFIAGQESLPNPLATALTATTTYNVAIITTDGCTAAGSVTVTVNEPTSNTSSVTACDSYTWPFPLGDGMTYTTSGTYTATSLNTSGCIHTETLVLTINASTSNLSSVTACDMYTWLAPLGDGMTYTMSSTYTSTSLNVAGCTHVETLILTINASTSNMSSATACDTYAWAVNGMTYTMSGTYTETSLNAAGCTHTETLNLTINNSTSNTTNAIACDTYTWSVDGMTYTMSGTYTETSLNAAGCTHTETLNLTINASTSNTSFVTACDSYIWLAPLGDGVTYTMSGAYTSTSLNVAGCTHVETLILTINASTSNMSSATACDTYTWAVNGMTYTMSGTYTETSLNAAGCTHTETLNLTINNSTSNLTTAAACDTYTWAVNGMTYTMSGVYTETSLNAAGCAHTETLDLTINASTSNTTSAAACDTYTWAVNAMTYTMSGTYTETSLNGAGCTHTETLNLTINASTSNTSSATACDTYLWFVNGMTYTMSGTYTETSLNAAGCTHTETLNLTINNSTSNLTTAAACDTYTWAVNGMMYTMSGVYTETSLNAAGCTHTETLNLTINASTSNTTSATACDSYTWEINAITYTSSGTYTATSLNAAGCTQTDILNLTINNSSSSTSSATACGSYTWACNGMTYTVSGAYTCTSINSVGCTHTETLILTINNVTITCPSTTVRIVNSGLCTYDVQDVEFDATTDICPATSLTYQLVGATVGSGSGTLNGVLLNRGITTVSWIATDGSSTSVVCAFEVEVKDDLNSTNYIIYAKEKVEFGENNIINGDVGVTAINGQAKFKKNTQLDPFTVRAKTIDVNLPSLVNNRVYAPATGGPTPAFLAYNGNTSGLLNLTVALNGTVNGNYKDLTIKKGVTCTVTGNNFGTIKIEEGACVTFTSPVINMVKMEVKNGKKSPYIPTKVFYTNPTTVKVKDRVDVGDDCLVNLPGPKVTYYVGNGTGGDGHFEVDGENSQVVGNIVIPKGELKVQGGNDPLRQVGMTGWYVIEKLKSEGKYVYWNQYECGSGNKPNVSVATEVVKEAVDVYPNPTSSELNVGFTVNELTVTMVKVLDMSGRIVKQIQYTAVEGLNTITMNISDLNTGVYTLQLSSKDEVIHVTRVVKN